jgi:outer membrane protein assembly factor BamE
MRSILLLPLLLAGCMLAPHKIDIQQGNYVDQEMVAKLKPDMTRSQVRFILGTPLVADAFHPDRWDYVFMTGKAGKVRSQRKLTVVFDGDRLKRLEGAEGLDAQLSQGPQAPGPAATGKP